MSTFQRSRLGEGAALVPRSSEQQAQAQLASRSSSALRNDLANVTAEPRVLSG